MKYLTTLLLAIATLPLFAATPDGKTILDKAAAILNNASGVTADFTIQGPQLSPMSGTIAIKGKKLHVSTAVMEMWFDGKTQWTYVKDNDEVNITTPTDQDLQAINPAAFIYLYKNGYTSTATESGSNYIVKLKAQDAKRNLQELEITVNKSTSKPSVVKMKTSKGWTTITVKSLKEAKFADSAFKYDKKSHPGAEVIDLR